MSDVFANHRDQDASVEEGDTAMNLRDIVWLGAKPRVLRALKRICVIALSASFVFAAATSEPKSPGRLTDLGGHRLHVNCSGKGRPTVVVESGLGDFSFDWILVQSRASHFTRICTHDRAGYAWSDP